MLKIEDHRSLQSPPVPSGFALWNLGFRPFYLLASSFAALSALLWVGQYAGLFPAIYVRSAAWHGHEMLYGYTMAVVAGFLLTAVRNWTAKPTPTGAPLIALAVLWVAGRVLILTPFGVAAAIVNAAFPIAVGIAIGIPIVQSRNRRNYFFIALLLLLGIAVLAFHLSHLGMLDWPERASLQVGLDVVLFVLAVMGGRVIPMFTSNGIPGVEATRHPWVEKFALGGVLALLVADMVQAPAAVIAVLAIDRCRCPRCATLPLAALAHVQDAAGLGSPPGLWLDRRLPRVARARRNRRSERTARRPRADDRGHRRHDDRHDDAHCPRAYWANAESGRLRSGVLPAGRARRGDQGLRRPHGARTLSVDGGRLRPLLVRRLRDCMPYGTGRCCRGQGSTARQGSRRPRSAAASRSAA